MKKEDQIREVLLMPICCKKNYDIIFREDNKIHTGQKYYSTSDCDMSDFAIGFYEIIYGEILNFNPILKKNGHLLNKEFAGDTMNSFNTIANITPGAGKSRKQRTDKENWPEYLQNYHSKYHCLANFWLLPMEVGRTTNGDLNKSKNPIKDYMDRFLIMLSTEINFDLHDREYFREFNNLNEFFEKHFLVNVYVDEKLNIDSYSNKKELKSEDFIKKALEKMEQRADSIAKSKYAEELWNYFNEWKLF